MRVLRLSGFILAAFALLAVPVYFAMPFFSPVPSGTQASLYPAVSDAVCGNGLIEEAEICDDGNVLIGDGCTGCMVEEHYACSGEPSVCMRSFSKTCGDGLLQQPEQCDDANTYNGDGCGRLCTVELGYSCRGRGPSMCGLEGTLCGNGVPEQGEYCDDGANEDGDGCSAFCKLEPHYVCEGTPSVCHVLSLETDGVIDSPSSTPIVSGGFSAETSEEFKEIKELNEIKESRFSSLSSSSPSSPSYRPRTRLEASYGDTPRPLPALPPRSGCGDGILLAPEACDDGDLTPDDGCSATCAVETGYLCSGAPSQCAIACGDGIIAWGETCDDGGNNSGDGCSASCHTEDGYFCNGAPSACKRPAICGNQVIETGETCDDGNFTTGDGCSAQCASE